MRTRLNKEEREAGYDVIRVISGHAYARNGNAHNPTPRHTWRVTFQGKQIGIVYKAGHAIDLVTEHRKDPR